MKDALSVAEKGYTLECSDRFHPPPELQPAATSYTLSQSDTSAPVLKNRWREIGGKPCLSRSISPNNRHHSSQAYSHDLYSLYSFEGGQFCQHLIIARMKCYQHRQKCQCGDLQTQHIVCFESGAELPHTHNRMPPKLKQKWKMHFCTNLGLRILYLQ